MSPSHPALPASAAGADLPLTIPPTLAYGDTNGPWLIRHGAAKLRRKYGDVFHSREFDAYAIARATQDPSWRNRIEVADLLATWTMQSQIERRPGAIEAVLERRGLIEAALALVPVDLRLEQDIPDQTWSHLRALFEAFRVHGVAVASMTKVLCMKRPALIPMMDTHVMGFIFKGEWPTEDGRAVQDYAAAGVIGMKQFRELMLHRKNLEVLAAIRDDLAPWLAQLDVSSRAVPAPSLVRVLDSLLWYDWNGHSYFGAIHEGLEMEALVGLLGDADHAIRWRAADALGKMGPAAQGAVQALAGIVQHEGEHSLVGWWAQWALNQIAKAPAAAGVG